MPAHIWAGQQREKNGSVSLVFSFLFLFSLGPPLPFRAGLFPQEIIYGNARTGMSKACLRNAKQTRWRIKINHHNALCLGVFDVCNQVAIFKSPLVFLVLPCPYIHPTNARAHCVRGSHRGWIWLLYSEVI